MVAITQRDGELAFRCLVFAVKKRVGKFDERPNDIRREMGSIARELGIPLEEMIALAGKVVDTVREELEAEELVELWGKVVGVKG